MSTTAYSVDGLHCQGCADTVTRTLTKLPRVHSVTVDLHVAGVSTVTVDADAAPTDDEIQAALNKQGNFTVV